MIKVKAAYLLNFTKFVTWPQGAFEDEESPIVIGVVGSDPFGSVLDQTIKDRTVSGRGLEIQRFRWRSGDSVSALSKCHLLYISRSMGSDAAELNVALADKPILRVGEGTEFHRVGGTLGFVIEDGRVVFWANQNVARTSRLELSSQLLKLAKRIDDKDVGRPREASKETRGGWNSDTP